MVRPAGFEPAATRLEGGCSIQLSYGRIKSKFWSVDLATNAMLTKPALIIGAFKSLST